MPMRFCVGYIYAMEFLPQQKTVLAAAITLGLDSLGMVLTSIWFMYISKDWKSFFLMTTLSCYLTFIFICLTITESPKFLVSRGRHDEARTVISKMFAYNKKATYSFTESEQELAGLCLESGRYGCLWIEEVALN